MLFYLLYIELFRYQRGKASGQLGAAYIQACAGLAGLHIGGAAAGAAQLHCQYNALHVLLQLGLYEALVGLREVAQMH